MNKQEAHCDTLIGATAAALNEDAVALMLLAVQKENLGWSVNLALQRPVHQFKGTMGGNLIELCRVYSSGGFNELDANTTARECLFPFPYLWARVRLAFLVVHADGQGRHFRSW